MAARFFKGTNRGMVPIGELEAYTPQRLEDVAESISRLITYLRENNGMTHEQAQEICGNWEVQDYEN